MLCSSILFVHFFVVVLFALSHWNQLELFEYFVFDCWFYSVCFNGHPRPDHHQLSNEHRETKNSFKRIKVMPRIEKTDKKCALNWVSIWCFVVVAVFVHRKWTSSKYLICWSFFICLFCYFFLSNLQWVKNLQLFAHIHFFGIFIFFRFHSFSLDVEINAKFFHRLLNRIKRDKTRSNMIFNDNSFCFLCFYFVFVWFWYLCSVALSF